jgi:hypothetical protein
MAVNLFVILPGRHPGANAADYFTGMFLAARRPG